LCLTCLLDYKIFNEISARRVQGEWNVFSGMFDNVYFVGILTITIVFQVFIIFVGGQFTNTVPLDWKAWIYCLGVSIGILFWNQLIRFIPVDVNDGILEVNKELLFKPDGSYDNP